MNGFTLTPGRIQRLLVVALLVVLAYIAWISRGALLPFIIGAVVAYVVSPLVERLAVIQPWYGRKPETARGLSVLAVYIIVFGAITVAMLFLVPKIVDEVQQLIEDLPDIVDEVRARIDTLTERYQREVPEDARERIDTAIENASQELAALAESLGKRSLNIVFSTVTGILGYISVPFFVFYALKDRDRAFGRFYAFFGDGVRPDVRECVRIANRVIGAYVRAQLFLGVVIFTITLIGLQFMGIEFAVALAFFAGVTELIPIIGPLIGFVPAFAVVLATEPDKWWWVVLFYLGVQAAENYLLVPRIHSSSVNVHPAIILLLLAVGGAIWGLWGVLVVVPLFAAARDVYAYIHRRLGEEEQRRKAALALETGAPALAVASPAAIADLPPPETPATDTPAP